MWRILIVMLGVSCLLACSKSVDSVVAKPGDGRLVRWSKQTADSHKRVIFIPGCVVTNDPNGLNPTELEDYFSIKTGNFEQLGPEMFGVPTSSLVEYWFYGYYPNQNIEQIADAAWSIIRENSGFDNCLVAVVGHSEGAVVGLLLDRRHQCLVGGVLLGGPTLSTPVAHKDVRDKAVKKTFPVLYPKLIPLFDQLAIGTEQLAASYPESSTPHGEFKFFAGRIDIPSTGFWKRNTNLLDALLAERRFMNGIQDNRQFAELGATIIAQSEWGDGNKRNKWSDGLVTVPSAFNGGAQYCQIMEDYDHWDLMTGKGDLTLDQLTLEWLDRVLKLTPNWVETDLPATPDAIELTTQVSDALTWARFAYVDADHHLTLTDDNWEKSYVLPIRGAHDHPQFNNTGDSVALDITDDGISNIYILSGVTAKQISFDGTSRCPAWSPNGQWITYQSANDLLIHQLADDERMAVVKGVDLMSPPVWTVSKLSGRVYFLNQAKELQWVSPRQRGVSATNLVQSNCSSSFLVKAPIGGIVVIGPGSTADSQRVTVVTGALASHLSVEVRYDPQRWNIEQNDTEVVLTLDQTFNFSEAAYDPTYNHLYLVGKRGDVAGIYLLDIQAFLECSKSDPELCDFFSLICEGASQLAIRPSS